MAAARGRVYLVDNDRHRVCAFDADTLHFKLALGAEPTSGQRTAPGTLDCPTGVAIAGDRVFVADCANERIQCFTLEGEYLSQIDVGVPPNCLAATTCASTARVFTTCVDPWLRCFVACPPTPVELSNELTSEREHDTDESYGALCVQHACRCGGAPCACKPHVFVLNFPDPQNLGTPPGSSFPTNVIHVYELCGVREWERASGQETS